MDRSEAAQEVQDIKRIMEMSRRQADRRPIWAALAVLVLAVFVVGTLPFLAPLVGLGLFIGGIVAYRRSSDSLARGIAAAAIGVGSLLILLTLLVLLGLIAYSGGVGGTEPTQLPAQPVPQLRQTMWEPDPVVHQPSRLRIIAALVALPQGEGTGFVPLKTLTGLTDGNLSSHLSTLEEAGYISVDKGFEGKKPRTQVWVTSRGRRAFEHYVEGLEDILKGNGARPAQI